MIGNAFLNWLSSQGYGTLGESLFLGFQPSEPHNCMTVYDTTPPVLEESQGLAVDNWTVQVLVRDEDYGPARDKLMAIHKSILCFSGSIGGHEVTSVFVDVAPSSIGRDEHNRAEWSAHYRFRVLSVGDTHRL